MFICGFLRKKIVPLASIFIFIVPISVFAGGGISIQGTRIIYPANSTQESISVSNSSPSDSFLVQSWVENADGRKSKDFVVTPPLYLSGPNNENTLRIMWAGEPLPKDRESLYFFIAKAIPSISNENKSSQAVIRIAAASRIKLLVRPAGLTPSPEKAPAELRIRRVNRVLEIINPTPYFITMTDIKAGNESLGWITLSPKATTTLALKKDIGNRITYQTINDYGALSKPSTLNVSP